MGGKEGDYFDKGLYNNLENLIYIFWNNFYSICYKNNNNNWNILRINLRKNKIYSLIFYISISNV